MIQCTQKHRKTSDVVDVVFDDPAAVVGVDATDDDIPALRNQKLIYMKVMRWILIIFVIPLWLLLMVW